jgi:hypothetical protein
VPERDRQRLPEAQEVLKRDVGEIALKRDVGEVADRPRKRRSGRAI